MDCTPDRRHGRGPAPAWLVGVVDAFVLVYRLQCVVGSVGGVFEEVADHLGGNEEADVLQTRAPLEGDAHDFAVLHDRAAAVASVKRRIHLKQVFKGTPDVAAGHTGIDDVGLRPVSQGKAQCNKT